MGWVANLLLVLGVGFSTKLLGAKKRLGILCMIVGEAIWAFNGWQRNMYDLAAIGSFFTLLLLRDWIRLHFSYRCAARIAKVERL